MTPVPDPTDGRAATPSRITQQPHAPVLPPRRSAMGREVTVGFFVIVGFLAVVIALFLLTDPATLRGRYRVATVVQDAGGIRKGDPVQMQGVNIGRVRGFNIRPGRGVVIDLELRNEYPVPKDSRVALKSLGLLGGVVADIQPGTSPETLQAGDVIPSAGPMAPGLEATAGTLGTKADTLITRANLLLSPRNINSIGTSTRELQTLLGELSGLATEQRRELRALSSSLRRAASGVENATTRPELVRAIARTDSITRQLDAASAQLNQASTSLATLAARIERGEGTLGKLTRDEALYNNLNQAAQSINRAATSAGQLTDDIRNNPKKYVNIRVF